MADAFELGTKYAKIDLANTATVVAAVAGKRIRVISLFLLTSAAVTVRFDTGIGGNTLTGAMALPANGGIVLPENHRGWFQTSIGELLRITLGGAVQVSGALVYMEVT
jgi:hypothetical protein